VPKKVIEILLGHFHPSVKKTNPAASRLAMLVCIEASNELQMHVNQHISEMIIKATSKDETPEMEMALQKIHVLIIHINKSAPQVLISIIPQLESGIRAENDTLREASVRTLGQMFAEKASGEGGGGNLAHKFASTWKVWLARCMDKSACIRTVWAEAIRGLLVNHAELWSDLEPLILEKLLDPDEKVRLAMIKTFATLDYETLHHHISRRVLRAIGDRALDKKEAVRSEALEVIGRAFSLAYPEMQSGEKGVQESFAWIPSHILSITSQGLHLTQVPVQHVLAKYILPLPTFGQEDEVKWTERYLFVLQSLEAEQVTRLIIMSNLNGPQQRFSDYIEACKKFNGGIIDGSQERVSATKMSLLRPIEQIASQFPDPALAAKELNEFAKQNDARAYKAMSTMMSSRTDLKSYVGALTVIRKKLHSSSGKSNATVEAVCQMAGFPFVGTSSVPTLINRLETIDGTNGGAVQSSRIFALLKSMADHDAAIFANHTAMLHEILEEGKAKGSVRAVCLLAVAKMREKGLTKDEVQMNKASIKKIQRIIQQGSHLEAKYAAKVLALLRSSDEAPVSLAAGQGVEAVCEEIEQSLTDYSAAQLSASMAGLKQFAKHANVVIMQCDELVAKVVQGVLTKPWSAENSTKKGASEEEGDDWVEDEEMNDELRARVAAIQFLTQRCLSSPDESEVVDVMIKPVLKLLFSCLTHGQPLPTLNGNAAARARIRCVSALSLLKLSRRAKCENNISWRDFQTFANTVQDETYQVRERFLRKLQVYWMKRSANLPARYFVLGFMTAFDPEEGNSKSVQAACKTLRSVMTQELRLKYFDVGLARLLHLLNHYPDFANGGLADLDSLKSVAVYLDFYLECCASETNLACLYYIANRCKGHQDVDGLEASEGLYRLSELTMCLIKRRADAMGCNVGNWAGKVSLPVDIFQPLPSRANQNEVREVSRNIKQLLIDSDAIDRSTSEVT
jgi:sister-chromatid-cohesion protein PDS5